LFHINVEPSGFDLFQEGTVDVTVRIVHTRQPEPIVLNLVEPPAGLTAPTVVVSEKETVGVLRLAATQELVAKGYLVDLSASGASGTRLRQLTVNVKPFRGPLDVRTEGLLSANGPIRIQGPGGFDQVVYSSKVLHSLLPGEYQVTASDVFRDGRYVDRAYDATVRGGGTVLVKSAAETQVVVECIGLESSAGSGALAFDTAGNLWVTLQGKGDGRLVRFTAAQLSAAGEVTTTPDVRIRSTGALESPRGFAFDVGGDLIIANHGTSAFLARFRASQLQVTGEVDLEPHPRLFSRSFVSPSAVAFDLQGGIWVADAGSPRVTRFSQALLTGSGDVTVKPSSRSHRHSLDSP
jgi:hypothetical protein